MTIISFSTLKMTLHKNYEAALENSPPCCALSIKILYFPNSHKKLLWKIKGETPQGFKGSKS